MNNKTGNLKLHRIKKLEELKNTLSNNGFIYASGEYVNNKSNINAICPKQHAVVLSYNKVQKYGPRCKVCANRDANTAKLKLLDIATKEGYTVITGEYIRGSSRLLMRCPQNHEYEVNGAAFINGRRCPYCVGRGAGQAEQRLLEAAKSRNYKITGKYVKMQQRVEGMCPKGHVFMIMPNDFLDGHGCPTCVATMYVSKGEQEVKDWLDSIAIKYESNNRNILDGKEIDVYIPDKKLGIEFNGIYMHSEYAGKVKEYHYSKYKLATQKGVTLIQIWDKEWDARKEQIKGYILSKLDQGTKIYGRQTEVKKIEDLEVAKTFLNTYHIQGGKGSTIAYGLFKDEELLGVVTFAGHHRDKSKIILNRLCFKKGIVVIGGATKLIRRAIQDEYLCNQIITTYSDNRFSVGQVYAILGFTMKVELPPDYLYYDLNTKKLLPKQSAKKKKLAAMLGLTDYSNVSENELAARLKLTKVWDAGKKVWILDNKKG